MHFVRFTLGEDTRLGCLSGDYICDLGVSEITTWLTLSFSEQQRHVASQKADVAKAEVQFVAPLAAPSKIIAVGLNYREQGKEPPKEPLLFSKFPSTLIGPGAPITWDANLTHAVDPEVELGVVIGQRCRRVALADALDMVFGYTVVNDVSARDLQFGDGQWTRGKNLDTFCPIGPAIVTTDEIADPQSLRLQLWVDDQLQQDGHTSEMIFSVAQIIAHISQYVTLEPGDLILTGTPWGVGCFRSPPTYLRGNETVRCTIEGIGTLTNPIRSCEKEPI